MTRAEIYAGLTDVFHDVFMRDDFAVTPTLSAADVDGWDSLKQIEIIIAVQQRFRVRLNTREIDKLTCVGDLANAIGQKTGADMSHV